MSGWFSLSCWLPALAISCKCSHQIAIAWYIPCCYLAHSVADFLRHRTALMRVEFSRLVCYGNRTGVVVDSTASLYGRLHTHVLISTCRFLLSRFGLWSLMNIRYSSPDILSLSWLVFLYPRLNAVRFLSCKSNSIAPDL